ncbi:MAG: hypothetical protein OEV74_12350 [Cyclobacteriaceae bacterium]|nr:hypothetical protein [Cyclobacteriaceae bacterium]MDH4297068.1 hypothetical protein [Cyclobacteriaceae bacterium]MDH5249875.1 hypothetical protein [Cyclobacteriaceae bacterium]
MREWSLIARYIKSETRNGDLDQLNAIVKRYPNLGKELDMLGREMNTAKEPDGPDFNTREALKRLNERLRLENLL